MTYRMYGALIASLSVVALMLGANETLARSGAAPGGGSASTHPIFRPSVARSLRHHQSFRHHGRNNLGLFWPGVGDFSDGPNGEPLVDVPPPPPADIRNTYTYDVPWDCAH